MTTSFTNGLGKRGEEDQSIAPIHQKSDWYSLDKQKQIFEHRAHRLVRSLSMRLQTEKWMDCFADAVIVSNAYVELFIVESFQYALQSKIQHSSLERVMTQLYHVFIFNRIMDRLGDFTEDGYLNLEMIKWLKELNRNLENELANDVLGLVEAWDFPDYTLGSIIGKEDGNVYEGFWNWY